MKCLVTGSSGYLGSHLVKRLFQDGYEVAALGRHNSDITDYSSIEHYFEGVETVFHVAALAGTVLCIDDPVLCYKVNVLGSVNVLEAARKHGVKRVVLSSSVVVYGANTPYKTSKIAMEEIASVYNSFYGLSNISLRYANIYGFGQDENRKNPNMFGAFKKSYRESGTLTLTGDGSQTRDMIHVSDVVEANLVAAGSTKTGPIDVCTGRNVKLSYIAETLLGLPVKYDNSRPGDVKEVVQDPKPAIEELGWQARIPLEDGIKEVIEEFRLISQG